MMKIGRSCVTRARGARVVLTTDSYRVGCSSPGHDRRGARTGWHNAARSGRCLDPFGEGRKRAFAGSIVSISWSVPAWAGGLTPKISSSDELLTSMKRTSSVLDLVRHSLPLYVGAGGIATACHYCTTTLAVELAEIRPLVATIFGFSVGALVKYWLNYTLAFRSTAPHATTSSRFIVALALLMVINTVVFAILNEGFGIHYLIAQVATTIVLIGPGYWLHKEWVFDSDQR